MKVIFLLLIFLTGCSPAVQPLRVAKTTEAVPSHTLQLSSYAYVSTPGEARFDLSGLAKGEDGSLLLVSDKSSQIFKIPPRLYRSVQAVPIATLSEKIGGRRFDLESIRRNGKQGFLLSNEATQEVLHWNSKTNEALKILKKSKRVLKKFHFNKNYGMEAICPAKEVVYLIKEQKPTVLIAVDRKEGNTRQIYELKGVPKESDITDCVFADNVLYLLNRNHRRIFLVRKAGSGLELFDQWDFSWIEKDPRFQYWMRDQKTGEQHDEWGTAEALEVDGKQVYVGLDNNGQSLRHNPKETRPVILVFHKPPLP